MSTMTLTGSETTRKPAVSFVWSAAGFGRHDAAGLARGGVARSSVGRRVVGDLPG